MTMMDFALGRRREWREEGRSEGIEVGRAEERARADEKQRAIAAISADPELSDAAKLRAIIAINSGRDA